MRNKRTWLIPAIAILALCLPGSSVYATTIAHWTFNESAPGVVATGAGSVLDSSGNGHNGTPSGGPIYQAVPGGGTGLKFDGSNDRVLVADSSAFSVSSMTVEAIVSLDTLNLATFGIDQIVFRGDSRAGADPFYLGILGGHLRFLIEGTAGAVAVLSPNLLPTGELLHLAGSIDNTTGAMKLFINGAEVASKTTTIRPTLALTGSNPGIGIGSLQDGSGQYLDGLIDEIRISDVVLTSNEFLGASVPEPATLVLLAFGLLGMGFGNRRKTA